jgi:hypothetical protein
LEYLTGSQLTERHAAALVRRAYGLGHVPDTEVGALHLAADSAVLPYQDLFSSGALLLALSLGVPVIAPADTTADELASPPAVTAYRRGGPAAEVERARAEDRGRAGTAALGAVCRHPWSRTAATVLGSSR